MRRVLFLLSCGLVLWFVVVVAREEPQTVGPSVALEQTWEDQVFAMNERRRLVGARMIGAVARAEKVAQDVETRARELVGRPAG